MYFDVKLSVKNISKSIFHNWRNSVYRGINRFKDININIKEDEMFLYTFMINFSIAALVLLNIHAYFVLQIQKYYFYCFINLIIPAIIFYYFDSTSI